MSPLLLFKLIKQRKLLDMDLSCAIANRDMIECIAITLEMDRLDEAIYYADNQGDV